MDHWGTGPDPHVEPPLRRRRRTYAATISRVGILEFPDNTFAVITDCFGLVVIHFATQTVVRTLYTTRNGQQHFLFTSYDREHEQQLYENSTRINSETIVSK